MIDKDKSFADQLHESRLRYAAILFGNEFYHKTLVRQRRETIRWQTGLAVYPLDGFKVSGFVRPYAHLASALGMPYYGIPMRARKPDFKIRGKTFGILKKAVCVYIWRRGKRYLYAGVTAALGVQIAKHKIIDNGNSFQQGDVLEIFVFTQRGAAERMLERIQRKHNPIYSPPVDSIQRDLSERKCMTCGETFTPKRYWQKYCKRCTKGATAA